MGKADAYTVVIRKGVVTNTQENNPVYGIIMLWSKYECTCTFLLIWGIMFVSNLLSGGLLFKESFHMISQDIKWLD